MARLDDLFAALADPTRRAIVARLAEGEATVKELASPFDMSLPAVSKHLKVLERAGLLVREVDGRVHRCRLQPEGLRTAADWVAYHRRIWEQSLDRLAAFLDGATMAGGAGEPQGGDEGAPGRRQHGGGS